MRKIQGLSQSELVDYVCQSVPPTDGGSGVRLWIRRPTRLERRLMLAKLAGGVTFSGASSTTASTPAPFATYGAMVEQQRQLIEAHVARVEHYVDEDGAPIRDGLDLWARGEEEILAEAHAEVTALYTSGFADLTKRAAELAARTMMN